MALATNVLVEAELRHSSGQAKESVINTFAFNFGSGYFDSTTGGFLISAVNGFYNATQANAHKVAEFIGAGMSRAANDLVYRVYALDGHLDGSPHGSPIYVQTATLSAAVGGTVLPEEVAAVITLRATNWDAQPVEVPDGADPGIAVDRPRERFSGRLYVGPFNTDALLNRTGTKAGMSANLSGTLADAAIKLKADALALGTPAKWSVWSRVDQALREIDKVQIDDAFDTQRRRGTSPSVRTTIDV